MVHRTALHGRAVIGDELDEERAQLHEGKVAPADVVARGQREAEALIELNRALNVCRGKPHVLYAAGEGGDVHSLLREAGFVERLCHRGSSLVALLLLRSRGAGSHCRPEDGHSCNK